MNSPFRVAPQSSPVLALGGMTVFLGMMIGVAWVSRTNDPSRLEVVAPEVRARLNMGSADLQQDIENLQDQIQELRKKNTEYEQALSKQSGHASSINQSLQEVKMTAGLTELVGPAAVITLNDAAPADELAAPETDRIVHDLDVLRVVNELWNAGAEAITVNNQRVIAGTSIRCVGTVIRVNDVPLAPPYVIYAIGDSKTLANAMNLPGNVIEEMRTVDPNMVKIEESPKVRIPAFSGSVVTRRGAIPGEEKKP